MEQRDLVLQQLMRFAYEDEGIYSMIQTGDRTNPTLTVDDFMDYEVVYGVEDVEEYKDGNFLTKLFEKTLLTERLEQSKVIHKTSKDMVQFQFLLEDLTKCKLTFLPQGKMQEYIQMDSLSKILINKSNLLVGNSIQSDVAYRQLKPTNREFEDTCSSFFMSALNIARILYRGEVLLAMQLFGEVRSSLDRMTSYYIGSEYDFKVNVGEHYEHFKTYLDVDHYEKYLKTFPIPDRDILWTSLFNACMLFRKQGLAIARKLDYMYPKRADRDILEEIRKIYSLYQKN